MSVALQQEHDGQLLRVKVSDKLTSRDYERFLPELEHLIARHGKIRVLFDMHDFHGWQASALWQDVKFDLKHFKDIERLAMVGEKRWEKWMAAFCRPFTTAKIRYFDRHEAADADEWVQQNLPTATPRT